MRLKYRLSILFLVVIAVGSAATLVLVRRSTEAMFRSFVFEGDAEKAKAYAAILAEYRLETGGWEGVQAFLAGLPDTLSRTIDSKIHGASGWTPVQGYPAVALRSLIADRVVVANARGEIVADTANKILGTLHPTRHLAHGVPIMASFERTGTVLVGSMIDSSLTGVDEAFLASVTAALVWATGVSAALALVMGLLFAARITKPLAALAAAAKGVASGEPGPPVAVVGRDELAELSASFNEMTAELRRLDAAKKQVIADSAHELRTPVTLIQGTIEAMIDGIFPLDVPTLESVHEETVRLARLIDTLRELEIIESGELELSLEGVDLGETLKRALALFAPAARAKGIRLEEEGPPLPPPLVKGDRLRLDEVVYNLLSNAIKYSPEGGRVRVREGGGRGNLVVFSVDDSGPGIAPEERGRVFERFYRIDKSRASETGGRGLGLAIASEIVRAHGGGIRIEDSELGGASFIVSLPAFGGPS
jgi:two-component system OmpR family sensor kinase/two-component system sensor histidine kinase BaeS